MNFLAHAFLSFHHADILVGNMISDYVKGNQRFLFPVDIQKGISCTGESMHLPIVIAMSKILRKSSGPRWVRIVAHSSISLLIIFLQKKSCGLNF